MKLLTSLILSGLIALLATPVAQANLKIVTTTQDPAAITRDIGGDRVTVSALAKGYQDPHFLDAKPSYMVDLNRADLVEVVGLDLEIGYLPALLAGARNPRIAVGTPGYLDLSSVITPLEIIPIADRGQGDVHPNGNPHYWLDPENGRAMARAIAKRLIELDPPGREVYTANLAAFEKKLTEKEAVWNQRLAGFQGRPIITYHRSWSYLAARYRLNVIDFVEPKPGIPPTPAHTLELIKLIQDRGVKVILMESFYDKRVPTLIGSKTGAAVVAVPNSVGGETGVDNYFQLLDRITSELEKARKP